jgi:hypothetical protein
MKRKIPTSQKDWLIEIADAYKDAEEAIPFGSYVGAKITDQELFHMAPSVCIKFRGIKRNKINVKKATEAALSSYVATEDIPDGITRNPYMCFALCYIASHLGLGLIKENEANEIIQYVEKHQRQIRGLMH